MSSCSKLNGTGVGGMFSLLASLSEVGSSLMGKKTLGHRAAGILFLISVRMDWRSLLSWRI